MAPAVSYFDKSLGQELRYEESLRDLVVETGDSEAEGAAALLVDSALKVNPIGQRLFIVTSSDQEDVSRVKTAVARLKAHPAVKTVTPALIDSSGAVRYRLAQRIIVKFNNNNATAIEQVIARAHGTILRRLNVPGLVEVRVPDGENVGVFINTLNQNESVVFAEPSFVGVDDAEPALRFKISDLPPEAEAASRAPLRSDERWNLLRIGAPQAWEITRGKRNVVIFVVDGPPQADHEAYRASLALAPNGTFAFSNGEVSSHATAICGIIVADSDQIRGVAPGIRVVPVPVDLRAQLYVDRANAIHNAVQLLRQGNLGGETITKAALSCSWRTAGDISVIRMALEEAAEAGLMIVCSAGNESTSSPHFPSDYCARTGVLADSVISVAATDADDKIATYSNYSEKLDLCAPGGDGTPLDAGDIFSSEAAGEYDFMAGTSFAAPHVAATIALLWSVDPTLSPREIKQRIKQTADPIDALNLDFAGKLGAGRLNAAKALSSLRPATGPTPPAGNGAGPVLDPDPAGEFGVTGNEFDEPLPTGGSPSFAITVLPNPDLFETFVELAKPWGDTLAQATNQLLLRLEELERTELDVAEAAGPLPSPLRRQFQAALTDYYSSIASVSNQVKSAIEDKLPVET